MLGPNPGVPLALKVLVVDQSSIAAVIVFFVVVLDSLQFTVRVDIRGEDEDPSRVRIAKVCGGGNGEGPDGDGLAGTDRIFTERDWSGE